MCAYHLHPCNDSKVFYKKPACLLLFRPGKFTPNRCPGTHPHQAIESYYRHQGKFIRRCQEAGIDTHAFSRSLADFHATACGPLRRHGRGAPRGRAPNLHRSANNMSPSLRATLHSEAYQGCLLAAWTSLCSWFSVAFPGYQIEDILVHAQCACIVLCAYIQHLHNTFCDNKEK